MIELGSPERIVIIDPAFLGDTVFNGPLIRALRTQIPKAQIDIVVRPPSDQIATRITGLDRVHCFDKRNKDSGWSGLRRMAKILRKAQYDLAVIPHPSLRSTLLAALAQIPRRVGHATGLAGLLLTEQVTILAEDSFVNHRLRLVGAELADRSLAGTMQGREATREETSHVRVGLCMGSAWPTKCWSSSQAQALLRSLEPQDYQVILLGAEWERPNF